MKTSLASYFLMVALCIALAFATYNFLGSIAKESLDKTSDRIVNAGN